MFIEETKTTDYYTYEKVWYPFGYRYYRLEPSENLNDPEMDGALVKRRISKKRWEEL